MRRQGRPKRGRRRRPGRHRLAPSPEQPHELNSAAKLPRNVATQISPRGEPQDGADDPSAESADPLSLQIEDAGEGSDGESTPQKYDITCMPADYTLGTLYDMWKSGAITIPKFQRGYVWKPKQASRLIESFMMDLPVPPVFLMTDQEENSLVIDGMQRLLTVFYFFDGCYGSRAWQESSRAFKIVGINKGNEIYGKGFDDLPDHLQKRLKNQVLRSMLIRHVRPDSDGAVAYHIFERLNTGGTSLSAQEIRNCIYSGRFNDLLHDMNGDKDWRRILGKQQPDLRMNDVQLALRCTALAQRGDEYKSPMKGFLSQFMHDMCNPGDGFILEEKERFGRVCRSIVDSLGERPFHNHRGALRATLLDAVFAAFANNRGGVPGDMKERVESLKKDPVFVSSSREASADTSAVRNRLEIAGRVLFG